MDQVDQGKQLAKLTWNAMSTINPIVNAAVKPAIPKLQRAAGIGGFDVE
jgi:hypothetical protein